MPSGFSSTPLKQIAYAICLIALYACAMTSSRPSVYRKPLMITQCPRCRSTSISTSLIVAEGIRRVFIGIPTPTLESCVRAGGVCATMEWNYFTFLKIFVARSKQSIHLFTSSPRALVLPAQWWSTFSSLRPLQYSFQRQTLVLWPFVGLGLGRIKRLRTIRQVSMLL